MRSLLQKKRTATWARNIEKLAGSERPLRIDGTVNATFPWYSLSSVTATYIGKTKTECVSQLAVDVTCCTLVLEHPVQAVALAACAEFMSTTAIDDILLALRCHAHAETSRIIDYIQVTCAACSNPHYDKHNSTFAANLLPHVVDHTTNAADNLPGLLELLTRENAPHSPLFEHALVLFGRACRTYHSELNHMAETQQWHRAAVSSTCLSNFVAILESTPATSAIRAVLQENFPTWAAWSTWKPNNPRLLLWQSCLKDEQRQVLRHLLACEGPEFLSSETKDPMPDAQIIDNTILHNQHKSGAVNACADISDCPQGLKSNALELLDGACLHNQTQLRSLATDLLRSPLQTRNIDLLRHLVGTEDSSVIRAVYQLYRDMPNVEEVLDALPAFEEPSTNALRDIVGQQLATICQTTLGDLQSRALNSISSNDIDGWTATGYVSELYQFGLRLNICQWHMVYLAQSVQSTLANWPTWSQYDGWCQLYRYAVQSAGPSIRMRQRLRSLFVDIFILKDTGGTEHGLMWALIDTFVHKSDEYRCELAYLVVNSLNIGGRDNFAMVCVEQCSTMHMDTVISLIAILDTAVKPGGAIEASINLAELLASEVDSKVLCCWRVILSRLIAQVGPAFASKMLAEAGVAKFVKFMFEIEIVFLSNDVGCGSDFHHASILSASLISWVAVHIKHRIEVLLWLEASYRERAQPALNYFLSTARSVDGAGSKMLAQSILYIVAERLENAGESEKMVIGAILAELDVDGSNASQVCNAIDAIANRSLKTAIPDPVIDICTYVVDSLHLPQYRGVKKELCDILIKGSLEEMAQARMYHAGSSVMRIVRRLSPLFSSLENEPHEHECKTILSRVALVFGATLSTSTKTLTKSIEAVKTILDEEAEEIMMRAEYLESLRLAFCRLEPGETSRFCKLYDIEGDDPLEILMENLPSEMLDFIEQVGDNELEIQIPLTNFTLFQRTAMGHANARNVFVRIFLDLRDMSLPPGFCVHFDDETSMSSSEHRPLDTRIGNTKHVPHIVLLNSTAEPQDVEFCFGRLTPSVYQISQLLSSQFADGFTSVESIYRRLVDFITPQTLFQACLHCNIPHQRLGLSTNTSPRRSAFDAKESYFRLARPTICHRTGCKDRVSHMPLDVSLALIRQDPDAALLLLSAVYAVTLLTAASQQSALLPLCPAPILGTLGSTLNKLPDIMMLSSSSISLQESIMFGADAETNTSILQWVLSGLVYKGFLVSATGQLRLPGLPPGIQQFVQVQADPDQEYKFASRLDQARYESRAMFHGTTLDRLFSILVHGLQVKSGSSFQSNGQSYGKGIYLADEMSTASGYSDTAAASTVGVPWAGASGRFGNAIRVLLGVELCGTSTAASKGIHVITEPERTMVRYVFICGPGTSWPVARHVTPAMESVFKSLRAGAI